MPSTQRIRSLDIFRGLTVAGMILVNNPGDWGAIYPPLEHAEWNGWTPTDLIFPFFVFIMGLTAALVIERRLAAGMAKGAVAKQVVVRGVLLFGIGLLLNGFPRYDLEQLRVMGVLQRLALCYVATGLLVTYTSPRTWRMTIAGSLLGYAIALIAIPVPGYGAGVLDRVGNLPQYVDAIVLGRHRWLADWDPEGILSTFPAIASCLLGAQVWGLLRQQEDHDVKAVGLVVVALVLMVLGWAWSWVLPINKNLWSSSYVLWCAGLAMLVLAALVDLVDRLGVDRGLRWLETYGRNALAVFVLSGLWGRVLTLVTVGEMADGHPIRLKSWIVATFFGSWASPINASLAYAVATVALFWGVAAGMEKKGWFVRL